MTRDDPMSLLDLANAIAGMRYADLMQLGDALYAMTHDEPDNKWNLDENREWTALIFSWAEGVLDDADYRSGREVS